MDKAFELTDEDLDKVSGGVEIEWETGKEAKSLTVGKCPGDCNGTNALTCKLLVCPHNWRTHGTMAQDKMIDLEQIGYFLFMDAQEQEQKRQEDAIKEASYSRFEIPLTDVFSPRGENEEA